MNRPYVVQHLFLLGGKVSILLEWQDVGNIGQYLQALGLGRAQAQAVLDVNGMLVHLFPRFC